MATKATELRTGMAVTIDGKLWVILKTEHTKPGKGPAYIQAKMRAVDGSGVQEKRLNSSDTVEAATLDRRELEYLYSDNDGATFMDTEDFDQTVLPESLLGDALSYLEENASCTVLFHDGRPVTLELPASVELTVADTSPQVKGATATNQLKEAVCNTGLKIRVPPFIETGERVKISTEDASYIGRAKE
ncbi:MAG: elongation factor P [Planctomycetota bacterium]